MKVNILDILDIRRPGLRAAINSCFLELALERAERKAKEQAENRMHRNAMNGTSINHSYAAYAAVPAANIGDIDRLYHRITLTSFGEISIGPTSRPVLCR